MPSPEDVPMEEGGAPESTISREELAALLSQAENAVLVENSTWYLVSQKWWNALIKAVRDGFPEDVGPIDNSPISNCTDRRGSFFLKPRLAEAVDYTPIPADVFKQLARVFHVEDERRDYIERLVVRKNNELVLEVYPRVVHVALARNRDMKVDLQLKPDDTMETLSQRVYQELALSPNQKTNFYVMNGDNPELIDTTQTIDSYFDTVQKVLVDTQEDGQWFFQARGAIQPQSRSLFGSQSTSSLGNGSFSNYGSSSSITGSSCRQNPGQCGLSNLGNTCFMASALQCLSNMPPLRDYFLSGQHERDLNEDNPLGTRGNLALSVGELFKAMWSGNFSSINPRRFKGIIGQFAPRFNGYSQQDSHELMAYVLDGLHEDLNRIKKKPYIEDNEELAKLPQAEYAAKSWEIYKLRNDSIIVDTLHGQLRSTLICPVCQKVSIKFDPFGYLSLPLPPKDIIARQTVIVMFLDRKWAKFTIGVTDSTTTAEAEELMIAKLQPETKHHFVFFCVPNQYNDDTVILRPTDPVRRPNREVYVAEVMDDPTIPGVRLFTVHNRVKLLRSCSLPMIYSLAPGKLLNREFLTNFVYETTKKFFFNNKAHAELSGGDDDDSMNGSGSAEEEPYKLFLSHSGGGSPPPLPLPPTNDPIPFPSDTGDAIGARDIYTNIVQIVFQWKDMKNFNNYKGADLIEREMTVTTRKRVELGETLDWFTTNEQLGEQDSWYCPQCKKHERATKKLDLWKLPEILILHLKRFQYTKWSREKLSWEVVIPVRGLDLTHKVANPNHERAVYDMIAASKHFGSLSGGHYTACGFNDQLRRWIEFNDSAAQLISAPDDLYESCDPYILVFRRRKLDSNGVPIDPMMTSNHMEMSGKSKRSAPHHHQFDENMEMEED